MISGPYSNVARPSAAKLISQTPTRPDAFDAEARIKVLARYTTDEELKRDQKRGTFVWIQGCPVPQEPRELTMGRQRLFGVVRIVDELDSPRRRSDRSF